MTTVEAAVMRLDGATPKNGWEDDAREGVIYADIHKAEVLDSGRQRNATPPMYDIGWGVSRQLGSQRRGAVVVGIGKANLDVSVLDGAAGSGQGCRASGADRRAHAAQAAQEGHPPMGANRTGGELIQDDGPLRGSWRKGARAVYELKPELLQAQSPALEVPALEAIVAHVL
ncbi:hypothetical protein Emag_007144 [Eimeria magna]